MNNILAGSMSHEDVEEVTADVFVTLWRSSESLIPLNLKGYLSRVARSLSMQRLREKVQVRPLDDDILILDEGSIPYSLSLRFSNIKSNKKRKPGNRTYACLLLITARSISHYRVGNKHFCY